MKCFCSLCGKEFNSNGNYIIFNTMTIFLCQNPCNFVDFLETQ